MPIARTEMDNPISLMANDVRSENSSNRIISSVMPRIGANESPHHFVPEAEMTVVPQVTARV